MKIKNNWNSPIYWTVEPRKKMHQHWKCCNWTHHTIMIKLSNKSHLNHLSNAQQSNRTATWLFGLIFFFGSVGTDPDNGQVLKCSIDMNYGSAHFSPPIIFSSSIFRLRFCSNNKDKWINYTFDGLVCVCYSTSLTDNVHNFMWQEQKVKRNNNIHSIFAVYSILFHHFNPFTAHNLWYNDLRQMGGK